MAKRTRRYTDDELRVWNELYDEAGFAAFREAVVSYAREQQGLTLRYWKLAKGPWFGEHEISNLEACADRLGVSVSDLVEVSQQTMDAVRPRLKANNDFMARTQWAKKRD